MHRSTREELALSADDTHRAYYANARADVLRRVPPSARTILDVGCGAGALGASIKRRQDARVVGIEYVPEQAARAAAVLDTVHTGDVATIELPYAPGSFDCLIYGDVLEHLVDPWDVLAKQRPLLARGGTLIVSLPNIQFIGVILGLLRGRWEYQPRGVLDRTHLRFFTRRSGRALIEGAGYRITRTDRIYRWFDRPTSTLHRYARVTAPFPWIRDLFTYQYLFVAAPTDSA
jgi:2-polyprenyl-3-methyl-5-hydroxy-6-metoxy-1,4-benzoquinol methylase